LCGFEKSLKVRQSAIELIFKLIIIGVKWILSFFVGALSLQSLLWIWTSYLFGNYDMRLLGLILFDNIFRHFEIQDIAHVQN
jgi:polyferredoxin